GVASLPAAPAAAAKPLCGLIAPPIDPFVYYYIDPLKTKAGAYGAVSGYLSNEDGSRTAPFSGSYAMYSDIFANLAIAWGMSSFFFGYLNQNFNCEAPLVPATDGGGYLTKIDGDHGTVANGGVYSTSLIDCEGVPEMPKPTKATER